MNKLNNKKRKLAEIRERNRLNKQLQIMAPGCFISRVKILLNGQFKVWYKCGNMLFDNGVFVHPLMWAPFECEVKPVPSRLGMYLKSEIIFPDNKLFQNIQA
jgi:hypothetical protein